MERVKMNKIRFSQVVKKGMIIGLVILVAISMLAITVANSEKMSSKSPTTLYVGGSGSGNYTTIQSAITASTSGDTIFVYDDSSPYYENVVINKGISLIGENRETTIIDGYGSSEHGLRYTIYISADWVNVSGFGVRNGDYGIYLGYSSNNSITSNQIYNNSRFGIYLEHSSNNTVTSNQVHNNWYGIYLSSSGYNNISGCTIYNNSGVGVSVFRSPKNIIANNTFTNDGLSISVGYMWVEEERIQAENQTVENNTVNGKPLYYFFDQSDLIIDGWEVGQLILADCINFTIKNLDISYTDRGIELLWSHYNNITDCTLYNNSMGISFLTKCGYNIISNCSVYNNSGSSIGINYCSLFNQISNCTIYNSQGGISTIDGNGEVISNCTIYNNVYGIGFWDTPTNILRNNTLENNTYNLWVHGMDISLCYQDIDTSNTINGKPIYYIIEQDDLVFNETMSIGYLAFVSCNNIRVENLILTNKGFGLTLANTSNSIVANCTLDNNTQGISLYHSANNTITNCTTSDSIYSIYLYHSSYNQITYCNITDNTRPEGHGIHISPFSPSNYNMFHHNNLINNIHNAYASPYTNYWDDGSEGNYWDDYTGIDDDGDDIGDTPYSIYGGIDQDNFPLMFPVGANRPPVIQSYTPVTNPTILETESQMFNITASDPDNDTITISWYLNNSLISTGSSYTFTANYTCAGIYEVKVIVSDGELSASHIWALTVTNVNRVPVLNNPLPDKFFDEDCSLINVFNLNDYFSDPDGEILDYTVSGNNHISVAINDNGTIDLQASTNWHGNETITFRATDPYNAFAEDIIVVTVNSVNDAPVIVGVLPNFDKDEDDPIWMLDLTNNKSDVDNTSSELVWSVSNWNVSLFDSIIVVDNNITFDLKANVYGNNEITITLSDGLLIDSQNIWINVTSVNDPPVIAGLIDQTLIEDVTFWYDITPYISDIDNDISDLVVSTNSSYIIVHNGNHTLEMIYPNGVIVDYVRITVSDGILSSYEDIIFTITPVNDAPVITPAIGNKEGYEDTQFTIDVSGNQYDIDNSIGDLVWSVTVVNTSLFTVSIDQNNDIITITPVANQSGSDTIVIHLSDGLLEATETITITIYPVNDPPVLLNPILDLFLSEGETIYNALNINDYFSDIDSVLSFSYSGNTNVIVTINDDGSVDISVSVGWHGQENITFTAFDEEYNTSYTIAVIVVNNPPSISGVPDQFGVEDIAWALDIISYISDTDNITDDLIITVNSPYVTIDGKVLTFLYPNGIITDSVKITVSDGMATANQTITVTITPVNDAPTISGVPTQYASEDTDLYFDVSSYINDVDNSTDELTISTNSSYATVNGFVITFNYPNGILSENVRITVSDGINTSYQDIMVIVTPVNDAPVIDSFTPISNPTIDEGKEQVFTVSASDVDNADLTITWYLDDSSVVIGNTYTFTSDYTSAGTHTVKVVVSDGSLSDEKTWTLIVNDVKKEEQKSFIPAFEVTTLLIGLGVSVLLIKRRN